MNTEYRRLLAAVVMVSALTGAPAALAGGSPAAAAAATVTVYINAGSGSSIAKAANESHAKMEKDGWHFANLEVHSENGDTQGAWITYVKR